MFLWSVELASGFVNRGAWAGRDGGRVIGQKAPTQIHALSLCCIKSRPISDRADPRGSQPNRTPKAKNVKIRENRTENISEQKRRIYPAS